MPKVLALIKKLPNLDRDAFRRHYEEVHVGVARPLLRHLVRYARHHVEEDLFGDVGFDVLTAFQYPDLAAVEATFAFLASDAAAPIFEDERNFMEKVANRFCEVSERAWSGEGDPVDAQGRSVFVLVSRPPEVSRAECSRRLLRDHWPALLDPTTGAGPASVRDAFPMRGAPPPFDGALQVSAAVPLDLKRWAEALEREGFGVVAVRTQRCVTQVPVA